MSDQPEAKTGRIAQIRQAYTAIHQLDPKIGWWMGGAGVATAAVVMGIGFALGGFWRFYGVLMGLGALGACVAAWELATRRKRMASLLWLPAVVIAAFTVLHLLTFGDPCYHHPMMPWLAIYAGYALAFLGRVASQVREVSQARS